MLIKNDPWRSRLLHKFKYSFEAATGGTIDNFLENVTVGLSFPMADGGIDLLLNVRTETKICDLAVELIKTGYPRDIRNSIWQLNEYMRSTTRLDQTIPFVFAVLLSPGGRQQLRERNIGYFDLSGSLFLKKGDWLVNIERPGKPKKSTSTGSIFTGAKEQVIHALLRQGDKWFHGTDLTKLAETSTYTVSKTLQELERLEWIEPEGKGRNIRRRLVQPSKLLDEWSKSWHGRKELKTRWYLYAQGSSQSMRVYNVFRSCLLDHEWTATGHAAANLLSPLLTGVDTFEIIVPPGCAQDYAERCGLMQVDKGANITLVERTRASLLFRHRNEDQQLWLASPFILYLDLLDGRGRNKELAVELRERILKI